MQDDGVDFREGIVAGALFKKKLIVGSRKRRVHIKKGSEPVECSC